jgi:hypothetical protein
MNESTIKAIQSIIGTEADGKWGVKSALALEAIVHPVPAGKVVGDGTWPWIQARVDGDDIVIDPGIVTAFGGAHDTMDSGETASGISTKDNPSYIGCALPMRRDASSALRGSPIPKIPWKTEVIFTEPKTGISVNTKLIDEGPAKWTKHIGDLTEAAAKLLNPHATANNFTQTLGIRIVGGARFL